MKLSPQKVILEVSWKNTKKISSLSEYGTVKTFTYDSLNRLTKQETKKGNVTDTYIYDAYGHILSSIGQTVNNYLYTGEQFDPNLGEYYLRARYYDPSVGRFTARDPLCLNIQEPNI